MINHLLNEAEFELKIFRFSTQIPTFCFYENAVPANRKCSKREVDYKWNLITNNPDDNKFVDCAVACDAKYLVSDDRHFRILKQVDFPKINLLTAKEFTQIL